MTATANRRSMLRSVFFVTCTLLSLGACQPDVDLPEISEVRTEGLITDVRAQIEKIRALVDTSPLDSTLNGRYGLVLATYGLDQAADLAIQRARLLAPEESRWAFYHAYILRRMGRPGEAMAAITAGLITRPQQTDLLVKRGELYFDAAHYDKAERDFQTALVASPSYPLAQYYLGQIKVQKQQWAEAVDHYLLMLSQGIKVREVYFQLANAYQQLGRERKAKEYYKLAEQAGHAKIADFDPVNMKFYELDVSEQPHLVKAAEHYRMGKVSKALEELLIAYGKNPNNIATHVQLVRMYGHSKNLNKAEEHYQFAVKVEPNFPQLHTNMGFAYQSAGQHDKAAKMYEVAVKHNPNDATAQAELGVTLTQTGRADQAIVHFQKSLELEPVNRDLRFIMGEALIGLKRADVAIEILKTALTPKDQKTVMVWRSLGKAYALAGDKKSALEALGTAKKLATGFSHLKMVSALDEDIEKVLQLDTP